jgi:serine/threonine protein kinase
VTAPEPGTLIGGRYLLEAKVAQGGMGAIYAARDQRLQRKVAVKVMLEAAVRLPGFTQRFEREARTASRLNHPNCVVVHDFGADERGAFLVLEWVDGQSLADLVAAGGPLPPARAADLLAQVCDGLTAAHQAGIVHRDVKPENVMVTRTADGRVVDGGEPELTQAGFSLGSPYFMSPEQALAESLTPGPTCTPPEPPCSSRSPQLRWNALQLRVDLRDPEEPDLVAASIQDLKPASDCPALRAAAERLKAAGDRRALEPLRDARRRLNIIDASCAGPVIDDAIHALEGGAGGP